MSQPAERPPSRFLAWLRVPPEPAPPSGSPGSLRVFRAGRNYLRLRTLAWAGAQASAIFGVLASLAFIRETEIQAEIAREQSAQTEAAADDREDEADANPADVEAAKETWEPNPAEPAPQPENIRQTDRGSLHQLLYNIAPRWLRDIPMRIPQRARFWMRIGETIGLIAFAAQFVWSFIAVRLDYALRWYMVTDRSLRLRWGVMTIHESTMSFANLQQVSVRQGPVQRLLDLADVEVRSAGGGSVDPESEEGDSMHRSIFHGVDNAAEIRDLILLRLQRFRQAGLGDPDDSNQDRAPITHVESTSPADVIDAARDLLEEVRAWRRGENKPSRRPAGTRRQKSCEEIQTAALREPPNHDNAPEKRKTKQ